MKNQPKINVDFTFEDYKEQARRMKETNSLMLEKIKNDFERERCILREKFNISLEEKKSPLKMIG